MRAFGDDMTASFFDYLLSISEETGGHTEFSMAALAPRVLEIVNTRGPCTIEELTEWLPILNESVSYRLDQDTGRFRLGARLVPAMCAQGLLIHAEPRGTWRSEVYSYAAVTSWLPGMDLEALTPRQALEQIVLDYIGAFGPVTVGDMVHWLGGVRRRHVVSALMGLRDRLDHVEILETQRDAYILREDAQGIMASGDQPRFVRFLPPRDGCLMAYRDPQRFVPPYLMGRAFDWAGDSRAVVLIDGLVQGIWSLHSRPHTLVVRLFDRLDPETLALVGEEARSLGHFIEDESIDIDIATEDNEGTPELTSPAIGVPQL